MTQPYDTTNVNDGDSIFEDAYVYGKLYYNFDEDDITFRNVHIRENLFVGGISTFVGVATFKDDIFVDGRLNIDFLTVRKDFEVGNGKTGPVAMRFYEQLTGIQYGRESDPFGWQELI